MSRPLKERITCIGIDSTDYCDGCGSNSGSGVLFNPGKASMTTTEKGERDALGGRKLRNFALCVRCLVSAMHLRMPPIPPYDRAGGMQIIVPIVSDEVGSLVWYLEAENGKALYLDNGTGTYPGNRLAELPLRGRGKGPVV